MPAGTPIAPRAADSLDEALIAAGRLTAPQAEQVAALARSAFDQAFNGVIAIATVLLLATAAGIWRVARGPGNGAARLR
ncbi:hypothetical protein [Niveispirillum fermenti]|uniref:hypothetical protein n=1 Tax=Niveispirillum fermenti TaxID=1233113 RepID=UPI003A836A35